MLLKVNGRWCAMESEIYRVPSVETAKIACFGPSGARIVSSPSRFRYYVVSGFSDICVIVNNPFLQQKNARPRNHKHFDGQGLAMFLALFWTPHFLIWCCFFAICTAKLPFSPQFWALWHCHQKCEPRQWTMTLKMPNVFSRGGVRFTICPKDDAR